MKDAQERMRAVRDDLLEQLAVAKEEATRARGRVEGLNLALNSVNHDLMVHAVIKKLEEDPNALK